MKEFVLGKCRPSFTMGNIVSEIQFVSVISFTTTNAVFGQLKCKYLDD